jgi:hypothetical protein
MTAADLAEHASPPHRACTQLMVSGLSDDTVSRFALGLDERPLLLTADDMAAELNDQFAVRLLRAGIFPNTAGEVLQALAQVNPGGPLSKQLFFLLGEGSQVPADAGPVQRNMRFLIMCGAGQEGPDVVVSSFHPDQGMVELAAWDAAKGGFNFYRTMPDSNAWVFAGNSRHALVPPTRGQGPFESHVNGNMLMKELKKPWVNWDSPFAHIPASALAAQGLDSHPWVGRLDPGGAYTLEDTGIRPAIQRWTAARVAAIEAGIGAGTGSETPVRMLEQLVSTLTINLASSRSSSAPRLPTDPGLNTPIDLPSTFFVDADTLEMLGLPTPDPLGVAPTIYNQILSELEVRLVDGASFEVAGDTKFAFVVPERSFEDVSTLTAAKGVLVTARLLACLLMVDFPNPVFSDRRSALLGHFEAVSWNGSPDTFSNAVADAINSSPAASTTGSPEAEFSANWAAGEGFVAAFTPRLESYYKKVAEQLSTIDGFRDVYRLAESRRAHVKLMPIFETPLLFSVCNLPPERLRMTESATVEELS